MFDEIEIVFLHTRGMIYLFFFLNFSSAIYLLSKKKRNYYFNKQILTSNGIQQFQHTYTHIREKKIVEQIIDKKEIKTRNTAMPPLSHQLKKLF
jgi:hypothetical protein